MPKVTLNNGILTIGTIAGQRLTVNRNVGLITLRLTDITYKSCGYADLLTAEGIILNQCDFFKISKCKLYLGAVNPEIPLETKDIRSYICSYSESNLWVQYKFKMNGEHEK